MAQTKFCMHQDPWERSSDPTRDWARLSCECPGVSSRGAGQQWPATGSGALNTTVLGSAECWHKSFWKRSPLSRTTWKRHSPIHQQKIGWKIYWAWLHPSEQDPDFPTASPSNQEASTNCLSFSIRGETEWTPQSQKINQTDHVNHSLVLTQWNYEPCQVGPPDMDMSWWRVLTLKCGPLEKGMANHFSIPALRTPWIVWKGKKIGHWKMNSPGQ